MPVEGKKSCCIVCIRRLAWHGMVHIAIYLSMYSNEVHRAQCSRIHICVMYKE